MNISGFSGKDFDPELYIRMLVSIAKADKNNAQPEFDYVRKQAALMSVDFDSIWSEVDPGFSFSRLNVSRKTALAVIRDSLYLAGMDNDLTIFEKSKIYEFAEKLGVPRSDVDAAREWIEEMKVLMHNWDKFVAEG